MLEYYSWSEDKWQHVEITAFGHEQRQRRIGWFGEECTTVVEERHAAKVKMMQKEIREKQREAKRSCKREKKL